MTKRTIQTQDKYVLRMPDGLRETLKELAERNGRSLNAEIIARLHESLNSPYPELSGYGFEALVRRLDGSVRALEHLFLAERDLAFIDGRPTADELAAIRNAPESAKRQILAALADKDMDRAVAIARKAATQQKPE